MERHIDTQIHSTRTPTHILSVRHSGPRRSPSHRRRSRCGRARSSVPTSGSTSTTFGRRTRRAAPWGDGRAAGWRVHLNTRPARVTADSIRTSICGTLSLPWCHRGVIDLECVRACVRAPRGEALCVFLWAARRVCVLPLESGSASSSLHALSGIPLLFIQARTGHWSKEGQRRSRERE